MTEDPRPPINYLARDYNSLRQMLLDRLALKLPGWTERHAADIGIALVELLAYVGDYLSYYQDSAGAEAYLANARQRVSLRRHARLLDYRIGDGLNARTFVFLQTIEDRIAIPAGTSLLTQTEMQDTSVPKSLLKTYDGVVFETMHDVTLFRASNRMTFHTGSNASFSLAAGATSADVAGALNQLRIGDVLILQLSSAAASLAGSSVVAHPVRIALPPAITPSPQGPITTISWFETDALPASFPVTVRLPDGQVLTDCTTLLGNMVLADEGRTMVEQLPAVPLSQGASPFNPKLVNRCVANAVPYIHAEALLQGAAEALIQNPEQARAIISLEESAPSPGHIDPPTPNPPPSRPSRIQSPVHQARYSARDLHSHRVPPIHVENRPQLPAEGSFPASLVRSRLWASRQDLLASFGYSRDFVAEIDNAGAACLRFGDGVNGCVPAPGTVFRATSRVGQGAAGNVATDAIAHIVGFEKRILSVRNPLPATGGRDPESARQIRSNAPQAFRSQRRCVTTADYVAMACSFPGIGAATATRTWKTPALPELPGNRVYSAGAIVKILALGKDSSGVSQTTADRLAAYLRPFASIGDELVVSAPTLVRRYLDLQVAFAPGHQPNLVNSQVDIAVRAQLQLTDFKIGQVIHVSPFIAAAYAVAGVTDVWARFQRSPTPRAVEAAPDTDDLQLSGTIDPGSEGIVQISSLSISSAPDLVRRAQ
jgi:Baseplate J-like protein